MARRQVLGQFSVVPCLLLAACQAERPTLLLVGRFDSIAPPAVEEVTLTIRTERGFGEAMPESNVTDGVSYRVDDADADDVTEVLVAFQRAEGYPFEPGFTLRLASEGGASGPLHLFGEAKDRAGDVIGLTAPPIDAAFPSAGEQTVEVIVRCTALFEGDCGLTCPGDETCAVGKACCPGIGCTDLAGDTANCGACGVQCVPGEQCVEGQCRCPPAGVDQQCAVGQVCCDSIGVAGCVDPIVCSCNGGPACGGLSCCPDGCLDLASEAANCGACGRSCGDGQCVLGVCQCSDGETQCLDMTTACCAADGCVNLSTDPEHCGDCATKCPEGEHCVDGDCTCDGAEGSCLSLALACCTGVGCVNRLADPEHCGACGLACGPEAVGCEDGQCRCGDGTVCAQGQACCEGGCTNPLGDIENCGACGRSCGAESDRCTEGECSCGAGSPCTEGDTCQGGTCV